MKDDLLLLLLEEGFQICYEIENLLASVTTKLSETKGM